MLGAEERGCIYGGSDTGVKRGEDGFSDEKHLGEVYEGKFLFVVMVTGSVVCSKNISRVQRLDQDPAAPRSTAPLHHFERGNADCVANV